MQLGRRFLAAPFATFLSPATNFVTGPGRQRGQACARTLPGHYRGRKVVVPSLSISGI